MAIRCSSTTQVGLVQKYVGTAYDEMRILSLNIQALLRLELNAQALVDNVETLVSAALIADTYLGPKDADPVVDNKGLPLTAGDFYFNTVTLDIRFYDGTVWDRPIFDAINSAAAAAASEAAADADATQTAADRIQTGLDRVQTTADAAQTVADAAQVAADEASVTFAYRDFDKRYLGAFVTDPVLDNFGLALETGALYFNTTVNRMRVFKNPAWVDAIQLKTLDKFEFTATEGQTSFTGVDNNGNALFLNLDLEFIFLNGVNLTKTINYTATNTEITLIDGANAGDELSVIVFTDAGALTDLDIVNASSGGTFGGPITATSFTGDGSALTSVDASTAVTLATARSISLSGDATGSASFNGSSNVTIPVAVVNNSHSHTIANISDLPIIAVGNTSNAIVQRDVSGGISVGDISSSNINAGTIVASGDITAFSDIKLKDNIEIIPNAVNKLMTLNGYTFDRTDDTSLGRQTGVIAQEVQKVLPEAIKTYIDEDTQEETLSVAYGQMAGLFIEAIKELKAEIEELKGNK